MWGGTATRAGGARPRTPRTPSYGLTRGVVGTSSSRAKPHAGRPRMERRRHCMVQYHLASARRRSSCKDCGGSELCEHGRRRSNCKGCGGGSICEHGQQRRTCKDSGGSSLCEHWRERRRCKECSGTGSDHVTSPTPFWQPRASAASCSAARYLYGAFVVAAAASGRCQLPLALVGELALNLHATKLKLELPRAMSASRS